jgi:hypothetical protein
MSDKLSGGPATRQGYITRAVRDTVYEITRPGNVARSVIKYVNPKLVVKVTRTKRPDRRDRSESFVLTIGVPNYAERGFVKLCMKAGEPFPVKKVQYKFYPAKKAVAKKPKT